MSVFGSMAGGGTDAAAALLSAGGGCQNTSHGTDCPNEYLSSSTGG
jgi:NaMN:DMB phosphoribosyltransferase